ncbi:uncharacterized protein LOC141850241 isoform X2 [Brevipalpus obovatus]|uniref:uncharacterized protein LOC141850241 isoform X2 n=1 Tax=Brevipalpus obovatus TaxID=246614 RepID=UPI003D9E340D
MYWNGYCLYAMMCFTSHISHMDSENGLCTFYKSEDVGRKSLALDASRQTKDVEKLWDCMSKGPFNTILIYVSGQTTDPYPIIFPANSRHYEHLIVLNLVLPLSLLANFGREILEVTSLTIYMNKNLMEWKWLENTRFKYIRIDSCDMLKKVGDRYEDLFFSSRLLTLTLVKLYYFDLLSGLDYKQAPNLRELSINHFVIEELKPFPDSSLGRLKRLNFANNKISSLPENFFSSLPSLEVLILEGNRFKTIHLPPTLKLDELYIDDNPIDGEEETCEFLQSAFEVGMETWWIFS